MIIQSRSRGNRISTSQQRHPCVSSTANHPMAEVSPFEMVCPTCGFRFQFDRKFAGRRARCPQADCGAVFRLPVIEAGQDSGEPTTPRKKPTKRTTAKRPSDDSHSIADLDALGVQAPSRKSRSGITRASRSKKVPKQPAWLRRLPLHQWQVRTIQRWQALRNDQSCD